MHIGLIDTLDKSSVLPMPNPAIASLAGYLIEHGHKVEILDLFFSDQTSQETFFKKNFGLIGITATSYALPVLRKTVHRLKDYNPYTPIVIGGAHASVTKEEVLNEPGIDFAIYGEGEIPLLQLVEALQEHSSSSYTKLQNIRGLIFRYKENIIMNPPCERINNLDILPMPPYDIFPIEKYQGYTLNTSRGCPYNCIYCASKVILGNTWVGKSPGRITEEIEYIIERWGKRHFHIVDDNFNHNENRVKEFCSLLISKKLDIKWNPCGIRADRTDPEMLALMKQSGCGIVSIGIESADSDILENIGKGESIQQIIKGVSRIKEAGLPVIGMFMIGNPGDTLKSIRETIKFAQSLNLTETRFYPARPYPGTKLWEFVEKNGKLLDNYENFCDFSEKPFFITKDFTYRQRIKAYRETRKFMPIESRRKMATNILQFLKASSHVIPRLLYCCIRRKDTNKINTRYAKQ